MFNNNNNYHFYQPQSNYLLQIVENNNIYNNIDYVNLKYTPYDKNFIKQTLDNTEIQKLRNFLSELGFYDEKDQNYILQLILISDFPNYFNLFADYIKNITNKNYTNIEILEEFQNKNIKEILFTIENKYNNNYNEIFSFLNKKISFNEFVKIFIVFSQTKLLQRKSERWEKDFIDNINILSTNFNDDNLNKNLQTILNKIANENQNNIKNNNQKNLIILGSTYLTMKNRLNFALKQNKKISKNKNIYFLVGERYINNLDELDSLLNFKNLKVNLNEYKKLINLEKENKLNFNEKLILEQDKKLVKSEIQIILQKLKQFCKKHNIIINDYNYEHLTETGLAIILSKKQNLFDNYSNIYFIDTPINLNKENKLINRPNTEATVRQLILDLKNKEKNKIINFFYNSIFISSEKNLQVQYNSIKNVLLEKDINHNNCINVIADISNNIKIFDYLQILTSIFFLNYKREDYNLFNLKLDSKKIEFLQNHLTFFSNKNLQNIAEFLNKIEHLNFLISNIEKEFELKIGKEKSYRNIRDLKKQKNIDIKQLKTNYTFNQIEKLKFEDIEYGNFLPENKKLYRLVLY